MTNVGLQVNNETLQKYVTNIESNTYSIAKLTLT